MPADLWWWYCCRRAVILYECIPCISYALVFGGSRLTAFFAVVRKGPLGVPFFTSRKDGHDKQRFGYALPKTGQFSIIEGMPFLLRLAIMRPTCSCKYEQHGWLSDAT